MRILVAKILGGIIVTVGLLALAMPTLLHKAGLHPEYQGEIAQVPADKRALIIATNQAVLSAPGETTGPATGVMASEISHPYYNFMDAGIQVDIASIKGGVIPVDPQTLGRFIKTPEDDRFMADPAFLTKVANSIAIVDLDFAQYDIVFLSGGWGAAYDLGYSELLGEKISDAFYAEHRPVIGGVCHGVLGLIKARDRDGNLLIAGRRMTGVTDKQIAELGIKSTPQHPEAELRKAGVVFESRSAFRDIFATHVVVDDEQRFVTGQNQNSGHETAQKMMAIIAR